MSVEVLDDLARARAAFETWRSGRRRAGRIPDHLWALAVGVSSRYPLATVCRELGLNQGRLRARLASDHTSPEPFPPRPTFVELRGAAPSPPRRRSALTSSGSGVHLRLERLDGASLSLDVAHDCTEFVERRVATFLRRP